MTKRTPEEFLQMYTQRIKPLFKSVQHAWWNAYTTGKDESYARFEELVKEMDRIHNNKEEFNEAKRLLKKGSKDPIIKRQLELIYNEYLSSQGDIELINKIITKKIAIEKKFNGFRAKVGYTELSDNQLSEILRKEKDSEKLRLVWEANKKQGELVSRNLLEVINLRNELARSQGFKNYYVMLFKLREQNIKEITSIFKELEKLTKDSFKKIKEEIDNSISKKIGIKRKELKPWHYQDGFFQKEPEIYSVNLDIFFTRDILEIVKEYYSGIGLEIEDILKRSDLYEKPGKSQHAFCCDLDKEGDIRILENIKNNEKWMSTTLHELGHGSYDKYIDRTLPFILREAAHILTTEGIAVLFQGQTKNLGFIRHFSNMNQEVDKNSSEIVKLKVMDELVFARWSQVMFNFEKKLYENPNQDLNKLWWKLVKKYQLINFYRDKPDWASKIHFVSSPVYYHNYLLGKLFASQMNAHIVKKILKGTDVRNADYVNKKEVGEYLKRFVFEPGMRYKWDELVERATGEKLTPKYFAEEFIE